MSRAPSGVVVGLPLALCVAALVVSVSGQTPGQKPRLRIEVISGEDAVNIIQQKTAVAPIVEVRDENDLPIAGVPVTFSITGGNATFAGGAQTLTVTTNAAGRAAVTGLNPVSSGAYNINVSAAFQGQTATATISQTNFMTAAQAANAGASSANPAQTTGAGGGGGGGLSTAAIAGIVGGAAAGGFLAVRALTGGFLAVRALTGDCTFTLDPASPTLPGSGGSVTVNLTADCDDTWTVTSTDPGVTVSPSTGSGNATLTITAGPNTGGGARNITLQIGEQSFTVNQAVACNFNLSTTNAGPIAGTGGTATVTVTVEPAGCTPTGWTASSNDAFLTVSPSSGNGTGTVTITASANPGSAVRSGSVTIAGQRVNVTQNPPARPCNAQQVAGGDTPETRTVELGRTSGTFDFDYETQNIADRLIVRYQGATLFDTGCVSTGLGARRQTITYSGSSTQVTVEVVPNCNNPSGVGTFWAFTVYCPR